MKNAMHVTITCLSLSLFPPLSLGHSGGATPPEKTLYMVDLADRARHEFGTDAPFERSRFHARHAAGVVNTVMALERRYGFRHRALASWVGLGFSAHLDADQVHALKRDPLVTAITSLGGARLSVMGPPWQDSTLPSAEPPYSETWGWGRKAVGGLTLPSDAGPTVYLIDSGVANHADLASVIRRENLQPPDVYGQPVLPIGCYTHSTHAAGIIAARKGNKGVVGVVPGARIVSLSLMDRNTYTAGYDGYFNYRECATWWPGNPAAHPDYVVAAIDWIKAQLASSPKPRAAIVNMSLNSDHFALPTLRDKMRDLATPAGSYRGAFIAQSAGNDNGDACSKAYGPASAGDGIMVVGAVDQAANRVTTFINTLAGNEPGSNWGSCVEVFAPGQQITSAWGTLAVYSFGDRTTWTLASPTYDNYATVSGTSMAAPHVAGVAAALLYLNPSMTAPQIEAAVRSLRYTAGTTDPAGTPLQLLQLPDYDALAAEIMAHLYRTILGREPDAGGMSYWLGEVERLRPFGADPRETLRALAKYLFSSPEYLQTQSWRTNADYVRQLYLALLNREADAGGLDYWLGQMSQGLIRDAVLTSFLNSAEFRQYVGARLGTPEQRGDISIVIDNYRATLWRLPDSGGFGYFRDRLRAHCGSASQQAAEAAWQVNYFFKSAEYNGRGRDNAQFVADAYDLFFRREVDVAGFNYWVGVANQGRQGVIDGMLSSPEWSARLANTFGDGCV